MRLALAAALVMCAAAALHAEARRIVSIIPATTEMLFAMGAGDRVVAVGSYDRFPPEVNRLPRVGALIDPNVERILTLKPDLVVLYGTQTDLRAQLERATIPVLLVCSPRAAGRHRNDPLARPTRRGEPGRGGAGIPDRGAARGGSRTRRERSAPEDTAVFGREPGTLRNIEASGGVGFLHDMLEAAGATDVLADAKQQSVTMSTELVLARAPDIIIELRYARGDTTSASDRKRGRRCRRCRR